MNGFALNCDYILQRISLWTQLISSIILIYLIDESRNDYKHNFRNKILEYNLFIFFYFFEIPLELINIVILNKVTTKISILVLTKMKCEKISFPIKCEPLEFVLMFIGYKSHLLRKNCGGLVSIYACTPKFQLNLR